MEVKDAGFLDAVKRIYVETTIVSYLAAHPSRDLVNAARQEISWEWWNNRRPSFEVYISLLVLNEAAAGDAMAARRRLELLEGLPLLDITQECAEVAALLITNGPLPSSAVTDAQYLAVAAVNGMDFLLTWNCRHLANAELREEVTATLQGMGYHAPIICTPDEFMD